jgi:DNA helicase-2/ATP-dependent DNA helicase PcrA
MALRAVIAEAEDVTLGEFLTEAALVADVDELSDDNAAVTLLTLHSAKGLEYPVVFITGLEEGRLPHSRSMDTPQEIAEERRLLYVGMTRAKERLYLTYAFRRSWGWGDSGMPNEPSRFLEDLPEEVLRRPKRKAARSASKWSQPTWSHPKPVLRELQYHAGDRVHHAHYGEGIVIESELDGRDEVVTVLFEHVGAKRLLANRAPITALPKH